jgi:hypothetical protein
MQAVGVLFALVALDFKNGNPVNQSNKRRDILCLLNAFTRTREPYQPATAHAYREQLAFLTFKIIERV